MTPEGLEFFTTRELIDELLRRRTFLGIVVHAEDEMKGDRWGGERTFCVRFNDNLNAPRVGRLLNVMGDYIEQHHTPVAATRTVPSAAAGCFRRSSPR